MNDAVRARDDALALRRWHRLLPELRRFAPADRERALSLARDEPLDAIELVAAAAALLLVTALTRYGLPADAAASSRFALALLSFAVALPLLAVMLAPVHLRRLRRGLRTQLRQRGETA